MANFAPTLARAIATSIDCLVDIKSNKDAILIRSHWLVLANWRNPRTENAAGEASPILLRLLLVGPRL